MKWVLKKLNKRLFPLAVMTACALLSAYLNVIFALRMREVIDFAAAGMKDEMIRATVVLVLLILCSVAAGLINQYLDQTLDAEMNCDLKKGVMHSVIRGEYQKVSSYHSGDLVNRLNADVRTVVTGLVSVIPQIITLLFRLVTTAIVLNSIASYLTWILIAITGAIVGVAFLIKRRMTRLYKEVSEESGKVSGFLQEVIEKLLVVKGLNVTEEIEKRTDAGLSLYRNARFRRRNMTQVMNGGMRILSAVISMGSLGWCAVLLLNGKITFGSLTAITNLAGQLAYPIIAMPSLIPSLMSLLASAERLEEVEGIAQETHTDETLNSFEGIRGSGVSFAYDRDSVISNADFEIKRGELAVIVGASGIGKSTLLKLILGIYPPDRGTILICANGGEFPASSRTRGLFAYAPQGNLLLSGTIRENILLANPQASEADVERAAYVSCMDEYLPQLPKGLDTVIGESGAGLSEGQGQRLSLARAIISNAPVLLLDEITSALDAETERKVLARIHGLRDRTCIVVTHRPAVLEMADRKLIVSADHIESVLTERT